MQRDDILTKQIQEFFQVQKNFHQAMSKLVDVLSKIESDVAIDTLLAPYRVLIDNPFNETSSGDIENDIANIVKIINKQNNEFNIALNALNKCILDKPHMNKLLLHLKNNPEISEKIQNELGLSSWLMVEGQVDKPFQMLMRYQLLLNAIHHTAIDSTDLKSAIDFLVPEIEKINQNLDTIMFLDTVEQDLTVMKNNENIKNEALLEAKINFVIDCIKNAKRNLFANQQEVNILYKALYELLKDIHDQYQALSSGGVTNYLYHTLFGRTETALGSNLSLLDNKLSKW